MQTVGQMESAVSPAWYEPPENEDYLRNRAIGCSECCEHSRSSIIWGIATSEIALFETCRAFDLPPGQEVFHGSQRMRVES